MVSADALHASTQQCKSGWQGVQSCPEIAAAMLLCLMQLWGIPPAYLTQKAQSGPI